MSDGHRRAPVEAPEVFEALEAIENPFRAVSQSTRSRYRAEALLIREAAEHQMSKADAVLALLAEADIAASVRDRGVIVSDHAVVRFIERFGGCDMAEIRAGIVAMIAAGRPEIVVKGGTVVTVLPEGATSPDSLTREAAEQLLRGERP